VAIIESFLQQNITYKINKLIYKKIKIFYLIWYKRTEENGKNF